jgi:cytochrome b subunit of formate dehydrogenase
VFHLLLIFSFLTQGATGVARMYIETSWGRTLAWIFGGYESCRTIHIYVGIIMMCGFALHCLYLLFRINWRDFPGSLFGPDSLLPRPKDIKDFFQHIGWFLGIAKPPEFDRWGYWEKFDYWAVFWGIPVLGVTGLLLAYSLEASRIIPGWGLNLAFWIHRIEAILAMCHVFIIHFFIGHLRRHNFPMDRAMFEGTADLEATRHERPAWLARLEAAGKMDDVLVPEAGVGRRVVFYVIGYLAVACGVFLLIGGLVNSPYITW